ncbi:MAG TPA: HD domain-containing protein [Candidatus Dormibacteraeota bacterium]|nr:HD domain-containing protein [Candidatus Dormibacteraeota bacterium]
MTRPKNIWDAVWGQIELRDEEWRLINTPLYQRLRRIHQLGMTMLVFPGATHTRFEHGIGTCHVAGRIAHRLRELGPQLEFSPPVDEPDVRIARLAALLHDIGHGPFSHVSDPFLNAGGRKGHEWIGGMAVEHLPEIRDVVDADVPGSSTSIADLLLARGPRTVLRDIVSGPTDADRIDYLRRDSHYTGANQGHFDYEYFIDQVVAVQSGAESFLAFRWNGIWSVEGLILARYQMNRTVYGHRNRVVTDLMLQRGLRSALGRAVPTELLTLPDEGSFVDWFREYERWDDWRIFSEVLAGDAGLARSMFERLRDHRLLKVLVFLEGEELRLELGEEAAQQLAGTKGLDLGGAFSDQLADELGVPREDLIAHVIDARHVLQAPDPLSHDQDINFVTVDGLVEPFFGRSEIFSAQPSDRWRRQLVVYAPNGRRDDPQLETRSTEAAIRLLRETLAEAAHGGA